MLSYKEDFFKRFSEEKIFESSSFRMLKENVEDLTIYGPYAAKEESEFIKETKRMLDIIAEIIRKPHVAIREEDEIVRADQAENPDRESFLKTVGDPSLWKRKRGKMTPEQIHSRMSDDTFLLYENRFVSHVLDFIESELSNVSRGYEKKIGTLQSYFGTDVFGYGTYGPFASLDERPLPFQKILSDGAERFHRDAGIASEQLKKCSVLKATPFYREVHKVKSERGEWVATNILLKDPRYSACFKFYKKYRSTQDESYCLSLYRDYVLFRIMRDLKGRYAFNEAINKIKIAKGEKGLIFSQPLYLQNRRFILSLRKEEKECGFVISVRPKKERGKEDRDDCSARYFVLMCLEVHAGNLESLRKKLAEKKKEGYDASCIVTLRNRTSEYRDILSVSFYRDEDDADALKHLFLSYHLVFEGDERLYDRQCPICGKRSVLTKKNVRACSECSGRWTGIVFNERRYLWVRYLGGK